MARYQVILAYDGTDFWGFQRQPGKAKRRTVQGVVETALKQLGWSGERILAAGRTDTGVHARGQVIAFDLDWQHDEDALLAAMNAHLPQDVAVWAVQKAADDFHPRYAARSRCYEYRLFCQPRRHPLLERYAWRVWPAVDLQAMQQAAAYLIGRHDFAAFGTPPRTGGTTIRQVFQAAWQEQASVYVFTIQADAFLYHMVRRLVKLQVMIGQGLFAPEQVVHYLQSGAREQVQGLAPAQGLTLVAVEYPPDSQVRNPV